eukprot:TRINITY_DN3854_c0_g1_i1.p1 TRINITY_DN3854_c0_g1~~TRINITY_DN3854_c0_g1_i1.p1  ORF type:complete len:496 (-),score=120.59 TRINITY_DN3854_c0_g1_i1:1174-2661(-)
MDLDARPKCAIFAAYNTPGNASHLTYFGLHAMQHRGQESSGIASLELKEDGRCKMHCHKDFGLVLEVFSDPKLIKEELKGNHAIGHNRYSTAGSDVSVKNIQPFAVNYKGGPLALAHNGNLSNAAKLKSELVDGGTLLQGTTDSELILHLMSKSVQKEPVNQLVEALSACEGAFSLAVLTKDALFGVRDPNGFRPLVLGRIGNAHFLASETCAFDMIGAEYVREIFPGEVIRIDRQGCESGGKFSSVFLQGRFGLSPCIFEYIYFARPDSVVFGESVHTVRLLLGRQLARECPVPVPATAEDEVVVMAVPDSSNTAALGYAKECIKLGYKCSYEIGLVRNHYVGRTFISPDQESRQLKVRCKFNPLSDVVDGKIVVLVDDSIVRGTTSKILMEMVRNAGAKEVHFRVSSPPVVSPCFYGMDFPSKKELLANKFDSIETMKRFLGADSLGYLSIEGLKHAVAQSKTSHDAFCLACFTEEYPVPIDFLQSSKDLMDW